MKKFLIPACCAFSVFMAVIALPGFAAETEETESPQIQSVFGREEGADPAVRETGDAALAFPETQEGTTSADGMSKAETMELFGIEEYIFEEVNKNAWLLEDAVLKAEPYQDAEDLKTLQKFDKVKLIGVNGYAYWEVKAGEDKGYVRADALTTAAAVIQAMQEDTSVLEKQLALKKQAENEAMEISRQELTDQKEYEIWRQSLANQTRSYYWDGPVLSKSAGAVYGPNGKETYYNLNMSGVIATMRRMGYYGEYWVRNDGCKMLGDYIMCAANLGVHPRGSLVECSLGTCIVCDTGGFAAGNPNQLDIATTW